MCVAGLKHTVNIRDNLCLIPDTHDYIFFIFFSATPIGSVSHLFVSFTPCMKLGVHSPSLFVRAPPMLLQCAHRSGLSRTASAVLTHRSHVVLGAHPSLFSASAAAAASPTTTTTLGASASAAPIAAPPIRKIEPGRKLAMNVSSAEFDRNIELLASGNELSAEVYEEMHRAMFAPSSVFVNSDISLEHIDTWGWDYDFTLVNYTSELANFVYKRVINTLVRELKYPVQSLLHESYDPSFAIKGICFDTKTGLFFKTDQFFKLQKDCVFRGRSRVPIQEVIDTYHGTALSKDVIERSYMFQDLFASPEACVLADVTDALRAGGVAFDPLFVQKDVREVVERLHRSREVRHCNRISLLSFHFLFSIAFSQS